MSKSLPAAASSSPSPNMHPLLPLFLLLLLLQQQQTSAESAAAGALACGGNGNGRGSCLVEQGMAVEMELSSEESRRLLWAVTEKKYISYDALKGDSVPCSKPGVPYYNCHTFPTAGPYTRGCQVISGCRGDTP
ncbi:rapid alkalinization factor-like [Zingiber officinale]|uniref:rapid alkalinization factor-like n=1 Tax=Zingiber officinale TaxID=94328 RepID=UPI001C4AC024|nr:rapid alkalinization factor-like [Zingiber officinale]